MDESLHGLGTNSHSESFDKTQRAPVSIPGRPYANARRAWLKETGTMLEDVLSASGHMKVVLATLEETFTPSGKHILDFVNVSQAQLEQTKAVCEALMESLGPSAQEIRKEILSRQEKVCATPRATRN